MVKNMNIQKKVINMKFSLLFTFAILFVIASSLSSCGMKRALYLPKKEEVKQ